MIQLDKTDFRKALVPLKQVKVNHFFARFVAEQKVSGKIYVDRQINPDVFYIVHPYGMSLLFGNTFHDEINTWLADYMLNSSGSRSNIEWLQTFPRSWDSKIEVLLGKKLVKANEAAGDPQDALIEQHSRVNFKFNPLKFYAFRQKLIESDYPVVRTNASLFSHMKGSVVPQRFWDSAADFTSGGVGFSVVFEDEPLSTAYSAYIFEGYLELGIETSPEYRGKGLAQYACAALIDYCLENQYEPVWSCRLENTASYMLAQKLGFEPVLTLPFYRLPV